MRFREIHTNIRRASFRDGIPLLASGFVLTSFVSLLVTTVMAREVSAAMSMGMIYSALVSAVPFMLSIQYCLRNALEGRRPYYAALNLFGFPSARLRRQVVLEFCVVLVVFALFSALFVPVAMAPLFSLLYSGFSWERPQGLANPLEVWLITVAIVLLVSIFPLRKETQGLGSMVVGGDKKSDSIHGPQVRELFRDVFGWVALLVLGVGSFLIFIARPESRWPLVFVYMVPFLVCIIAVLAYAVFLFVVERRMVRRRGMDTRALIVRHSGSYAPKTVIRVCCLFVLLPMILFITNDAALYSARLAFRNSVMPSYVVSSSSGEDNSLSSAVKNCESDRDNCAGVLSWVPAVGEGESVAPSSKADGAIYAVVEDRPGVLKTFHQDPDDTESNLISPFDQPWMKPWDKAVSAQDSHAWLDEARQQDAFSVAVFSQRPQGSFEGARVLSAQDFADHLPERMFYGPNGTGTSEFIPLFAYVIVSGAVFIFSFALARQEKLIQFGRQLQMLGVSGVIARRNRVVANALPAGFAVSLSLCAALFLSSLMKSRIAHAVVVSFPSVPAGLLAFLLLFVVFSVVGSCLAPRERDEVENKNTGTFFN